MVALTGANLSSTFTINNAESMKGLEVLENRLPQAAGTSEQVLFTAKDGDIEAHRQAIEGFVSAVSAMDGVAMVSQPFGSAADAASGTPASPSTVSQDGAHALARSRRTPPWARSPPVPPPRPSASTPRSRRPRLPPRRRTRS